MNTHKDLFSTITSADWRHTFRANRPRRNHLLESIHERIQSISTDNPALQRELQNSTSRYRQHQDAAARRYGQLCKSDTDAGVVTENQGEQA